MTTITPEDTDAFVLDPSIAIRRSPAESGVARYVPGEAVPTTSSSRQAKLIAQLQNPEPRAVVVHLSNKIDGGTREFDQIVGNSTLMDAAVEYAGAVLEWGDLSVAHRVLMDFKSGAYQLPACTYVRLFGFAWTSTAAIVNTYNLFGTLSRGMAAAPKTPQVTARGSIAAGASATVAPNAYARLFDVWASGWNAGAGGIGTLDAPIIRVPELAIERNYQTGLYAPPWGPVECFTGTDSVTITNAGPAAVTVTAKFLLEL